ncbi:MAG: type II toxin-antitoxin system RelE/ParE family toxin [Candidatus Saccharibacteria bacterium]|nr:type II toxin-antitoxin system RelE/ParE family toxin [Moraxellaceae bacterium]
MIIQQTHDFARTAKKLSKQQKLELDKAVKTVSNTPEIGEMKQGDLAGVQVYKFRMNNQLALLAYRFELEIVTLYLLKIGSHENFYRDLKRD